MSGKAWVKDHLFGTVRAREEMAGAGLLAWLSRVQVSERQSAGDLDIFPLRFVCDFATAPLLLGHEAVAQGRLEIRERGQGGEVQELEALNRANVPVLLLEGETLVGCKQNRVVAHTVIIAAGATVVVPVGCMQQGRWSNVGPRFASGPMRVSPDFRRQAVRETSAARSSGGPVHLDQGRLWDQVSDSLSACAVASPSRDYEELLSREHDSLRREASTIRRVPGEVGIIVFRGADFLGLDLLGHPEHWQKVAERTLPSYLLWSRQGRQSGQQRRSSQDATDVLASIGSAQVEEHPGLGLGVDLLIASGKHHGSGLWFESAPACLSLFGQ